VPVISQLQNVLALFNVLFVLSHVSGNFFVHFSEYLWVRGCQTIIWDNVIAIMIKQLISFEVLTAVSIKAYRPVDRDVI
jgi:hypothetical protein